MISKLENPHLPPGYARRLMEGSAKTPDAALVSDDQIPFQQAGAPCHATVYQLDDWYMVIACPEADTAEGKQGIVIPVFFRMENGKFAESTADPTEWNRHLETRRQELSGCNRSTSNQPPSPSSTPSADPAAGADHAEPSTAAPVAEADTPRRPFLPGDSIAVLSADKNDRLALKVTVGWYCGTRPEPTGDLQVYILKGPDGETIQRRTSWLEMCHLDELPDRLREHDEFLAEIRRADPEQSVDTGEPG